MPTFPTYGGELPPCLHFLNLRHYLLLAYWVFFRPTALKCYLYQADSELYRAGWGLNIFDSLRQPAYRNLYVMVVGVSLSFWGLAALSSVIMIATKWIQSDPASFSIFGLGQLDLGRLALAIAENFVAFVASAFVLVIAFSVTSDLASGVTVGVAFGVAAGIVMGVLVNVVLVFSLVFVVDLIEVTRLLVAVGMGIVFGVAFGVAWGAVLGVAVGVGMSVQWGVTFGAAAGVLWGVGTLRLLPFYPFQLVLALRNKFQSRYPLEWDELVILPLPGTQQLLTKRLQQDEKQGLRLVADVARNPFQRPYAQQVCQAYLHRHSAPLEFIYTLLACSDLNEYVVAPVEKKHWLLVPTTKKLLLGELNGQLVNCYQPFERLIWWMGRDLRKTPLTHFAGMLYQLLEEKTVDAEDFDLSSYRKTYSTLTDYPRGSEIANSLEAMATFLSYKQLSALPAASEVVEKLQLQLIPLETAIRPNVITALTRLVQIGAEIATYQDATTGANKQKALLRATDALNKLDEYAIAEVVAPERTILRRIIRQWRPLVSEAGGELGSVQNTGPVPNPYIAGNPVIGDLFVGRQDILRELEELWTKPGQCPSVVLYGHRRMGKSSILQNLGKRFGAQTVIIDFNMQRVGNIASTGELFHALALKLYDSLTPAGQQKLAEPQEESFTTRNPYNTLNRFLQQLDGLLGGEQRYIVTLDEFEVLEKKIEEQRLEPNLLEYWRGLIQTYPWLIMAFAGLHNLEEMRRDYWHPLYSSVKAIPVSFLSAKAAERLITEPSSDFDINYDPEAIERIINLTNGQAYLIQHICHALVTRFNRQTFEEGREGERRFTLEDVSAVIDAPEFYREGDAYFNGVWEQAQKSKPEGQLKILEKLSSREMSLGELVAETAFTPEQVEEALKTLRNHDVIEQRGEKFAYTVKLMQRWVAGRNS